MRPIRIINKTPGLRKLAKVLLYSISKLVNAGAILLFFILIASILGVSQFQGMMEYRCRSTSQPVNGTYWPVVEDYERLCKYDSDCPSLSTCGSPNDYLIEHEDDNIDSKFYMGYGTITFDNIFLSMVLVFQSLTRQGWSQHMYNLMDSYNAIFSATYFMFIIIVGAFFLLNFILAAII